MNWFKWVQFSIMLAAQILPLIKQTEDVVGAGNGPTKKQTVLTAAAMSATMAGANPDQVQSTLAAADKMVDDSVDLLNAAGILGKKE